jgi:site-specific recombinase XerD
MQNSNETTTRKNTAIAFVDYKPAELRTNKTWIIVYYARNPITNELERFRNRVPTLNNIRERKEYGKKIVFELNEKLKNGWLPFYEVSDIKEFKTISYCVELYVEYLEKDFTAKEKRFDTLRSYRNVTKKFYAYLLEKEPKSKLILELKKDTIVRYLDYLLYVKEIKAITYNNNLILLGIFFKWCIDRGYLKNNPTEGILKKKKQPKVRQVLTPEIKTKLKAYGVENPNFYTVCMLTYYCYIRTTELTKIKVRDVKLFNGYILLHGCNTKNKKDESVTIPNQLVELLATHLAKANNDDYLFGYDNFAPGSKQLTAKKITIKWDDFRTKFDVAKIYQFYSLKDTGITDLLNSGVPTLKVRDQARHYDLKITELYASRNTTCDETVRNASFNF